MPKHEMLKRYLFFIFGLFVLSLGVALSAKADLGTPPISAVPYVLSLGFPLTIGQFLIILHCIFILLQIALLRKDYEYIQLLQLPVAFVFGVFTDFSLFLLSWINPTSYLIQWIWTSLSFVVVALGISMEVTANVVMLAGEGLVRTIAQVTHKDFGTVKVILDISLITIAVIFSFLLFGKLNGVREGTIASALLVGTITGFFNKKLKIVNEIFKK